MQLTTPDEVETVTVPAQVTLIPNQWRVERNGAYLGEVSVYTFGETPWRAFWFNDSEDGGDGSSHATRDEAVAAVVAGSNR